jgi:predicted ArsR family transcriptional regulator
MKFASAQQAMQRACGPKAWTALALLRVSEGRSQDELAERLGIGQPSVSTLLADLEDLGLACPVSQDQGSRGRPKTRWKAVGESVDSLLNLGEHLITHEKQ